MSKAFIASKFFFLVLLLLIFVPPVLAEENPTTNLKIGLFNLLKPKKINIKVVGSEIVALETFSETNTQINTPKVLLLRPKETLTLVATTDKINCYLRNSSQEIKQHWIAKSLSLSGNEDLELFVANRLSRQIPAKLNFQSSNNLLKTILLANLETSIGIITASELSAIDNITSEQALESFKTLSIAIRSYVLYEKGRHSKEGYDLCDNTHCLLYLGQNALTNNKQRDIIERAIKETSKMVITYQDKIVPGYFTACCGGVTALPNEVWTGKSLSSYSFQSINCNYCQKDRFYEWERSADTKAIWKALELILTFHPTENTKLIPVHNKRGVVTSLLVKENYHQIKVSAAKFRHLLGKELGWNLVLSNFYIIVPKGQKVIFQGRGFGHNLGLCLAGANEQARQGFSYSDILKLYFPDTTLSKSQ